MHQLEMADSIFGTSDLWHYMHMAARLDQ